jgi:minor histocompatibility antigen H13
MPELNFELPSPELGLAYAAIMTMAAIPIYIGSFLSLKQKKGTEAMKSKDAFMFPVIASCFLFGLYLLFKTLNPDLINMLLTIYFMFFGIAAMGETFKPLIYNTLPKSVLKSLRGGYNIDRKIPFKAENLKLKFTNVDVLSFALSGIVGVWYLVTKHWVANNIIGLAFCVQGISLLSLGQYKIGCILLGGLFFYDIFWVFGTEVMVTVAKSFDAPIKLLFPKNLFDPLREPGKGLSMLGLGDIVLPGVLIAFLLRYDAHRAGRKINFAKPYFQTTFIAYVLGLFTTMFVMHTFKAAQPALLYLVPACIGASFLLSMKLKDSTNLLAYDESEKPEDAKE